MAYFSGREHFSCKILVSSLGGTSSKCSSMKQLWKALESNFLPRRPWEDSEHQRGGSEDVSSLVAESLLYTAHNYHQEPIVGQ